LELRKKAQRKIVLNLSLKPMARNAIDLNHNCAADPFLLQFKAGKKSNLIFAKNRES